MLTDSQGNVLPYEEVHEMASNNIDASMAKHELVWAYMDSLDVDEIVEWATDENGEFPDGE